MSFSRSAATIVCLSVALTSIRAEENVGWRFWTAAEGLSEAYTTSVTALPGNGIAVRHGDVASFDVLDGFHTRAIADRHWLGRLYEDSDGTLYTFNDGNIATFQNGVWTTSPLAELNAIATLKKFAFRVSFTYANRRTAVADGAAAVVPVAPGRALILVPGRILEWTRGGGTRLIRTVDQTGIGEFHDLRQAGAGSAWLTGKLGFARITLKDARTSLYDWAEVIPGVAGVSAFSAPVVQADGKIFVTARRNSETLVGLTVAGKNVSLVATVQGSGSWLWPGGDGRVWKADGKTIGFQEGNQYRELHATPELAGQILDVLPEKSGSFWMATSQKLAHYTPPLWREAPGAPPLDEVINSIAEDAKGRMWFSIDHSLVMSDHGTWQRYPLPAKDEYRLSDPKTISVLQDGTIFLDIQGDDHRIIFDPRTGRFRKFTRGKGLFLGFVMPRPAGGMWVQSYVPEAKTFRLEILEGGVYHEVPGMDQCPMAEVRDLLTSRDGDIWIGTTRYLARLHKGRLHIETLSDGFADSGAYALVEMADGKIFVGGRDGVTIWDGTRFGPIQRRVERTRSFTQTADGTLWAAAGTGVFRFSGGEWIGNSSEEGLPGAGYKVFADSRGVLWAGTTFGLRQFHPESDREAPTTAISEERNLRETPPGGDVKLNFTGADKWRVTDERRLLFSYALDGGPWTHFDDNDFASYKTLATGQHVFHVRAMDRNGNVDPRPASFDFSVLRPLYREPLFLALLFFATIAVAMVLRLVIARHLRLRFESRHDPLTRLLNRAAFESALDRAIHTAGDRSLSVMFIDLDGFKAVNDKLGHRFGDLLLVALSGRFASSIRTGGRQGHSNPSHPALARVGGDEFAIILPGTNQAEAESIAARILDTVRGCTAIEGHSIKVSCCIGISLYPVHTTDATTLVRLADLAMYRGKAGSKNCCTVHDPAGSGVDFRQSGMAVVLREAIEKDQLFLVYQPIQDIQGNITEIEALVRIAHPERGVLMPGDFIRVAEETGLVIPMGKWVLREALRQARVWQELDIAVRVAVNISPVQLNNPGFADLVFESIDEAGVPPVALAIEITESALAQNWDAVAPQIQRLRAAGVSVSLDDFGTGYSSLSRLHRLPVDRVKIDRSFIQGMHTAEHRPELIRDTISLAHHLGYIVVGEGVESPEQVNELREMACDQYQGFLLSRPVPPQEATRLLTAAREAALANSSDMRN